MLDTDSDDADSDVETHSEFVADLDAETDSGG